MKANTLNKISKAIKLAACNEVEWLNRTSGDFYPVDKIENPFHKASAIIDNAKIKGVDGIRLNRCKRLIEMENDSILKIIESDLISMKHTSYQDREIVKKQIANIDSLSDDQYADFVKRAIYPEWIDFLAR